MAKLALAIAAVFAAVAAAYANEKVVCYYDSKSYFREGQGKMKVSDLEPALPFCTHLVYGFAGINKETNKMVPLNENFDITKNNYRMVTDLKKRFPALRVLLSVGGFADDQDTEKYLELLEKAENRIAFVNSAHTLIKAYGFDGLDLAWQFPTSKPKKIRGTFSSAWHGFKKLFTGDSNPDEHAEEHKEQFTALVREIKNVFRHDGLLLTASVLPNVNSSIYYDTRSIIQNLDHVHLLAYDFQTSDRNPKEADFPAPLYPLIERNPESNGDFQVRRWLETGAPNNKLILGIPTYGRTWKMTEDSSISGVPPFKVKGGAEPGNYTLTPGLLSYPEICGKLPNANNAKDAARLLRKVGDPSKRFGTYAFRLPDANEEGGIWVGYEDPDTAGNKAGYIRAKGLGGVAVMDLSLDDFRGLCTGDKFPVLRAAKFRL